MYTILSLEQTLILLMTNDQMLPKIIFKKNLSQKTINREVFSKRFQVVNTGFRFINIY